MTTADDIMKVAKHAALRAVARFGGLECDYIGEAYIAATAAAKRFDPAHGCKFATFASLNVERHVSDTVLADMGYRRTAVNGVRTRRRDTHKAAGELHEGIRSRDRADVCADADDTVRRNRNGVRAWEYLRLLAAGLNQPQMARAIGISGTMVHFDMRRLRDAAKARRSA